MGVAHSYPTLVTSEEHMKDFLEPPFIAFRRCQHLRDILVSSELHSSDSGPMIEGDVLRVISQVVKSVKLCAILIHLSQRYNARQKYLEHPCIFKNFRLLFLSSGRN